MGQFDLFLYHQQAWYRQAEYDVLCFSLRCKRWMSFANMTFGMVRMSIFSVLTLGSIISIQQFNKEYSSTSGIAHLKDAHLPMKV